MVRFEARFVAEELFGQALEQEAGNQSVQVALMRHDHFRFGQCGHAEPR
jgi:hypothetical protein